MKGQGQDNQFSLGGGSTSGAAKGETLILKEGHILFEEGDVWDGLYFIRKGRIEILRERAGKEFILNCLKEGEFIGTATLITRAKRLATARAACECVLDKYEPRLTDAMIKSMPKWGKAVLKEVLKHLTETDEALIKARLEKQAPPPPPLPPVQELLEFIRGLHINGYGLTFEVGENTRRVLPINTLDEWMEPVMHVPAKTIWKVVELLQEYEVIKIEVCGRLGRCILDPDVKLYEDILTSFKKPDLMSAERAKRILANRAHEYDLKVDALAASLKEATSSE